MRKKVEAFSQKCIILFLRIAMEEDKITQVLEAVIMASPEPVKFDRLCRVLDGEAERKQVRKALKTLQEELAKNGRGYRLAEIAGGYQFLTAPEYASYVKRLKTDIRKKREQGLSRAALETLAIIAYKQPVKRINIEAIRGVSVGDLIRMLIEKDLVKVVGREQSLGKPLLYGTTNRFLKQFGLKSLKSLPDPAELSLD
jgi:segregation and condensation protein B